MVPRNEGKCCDAVIRVLEGQTGHPRMDMRFPERDLAGPPVEVEFKLGNQIYALEHTVLESFSGQIGTGLEFMAMSKAISDALETKLPKPGVYYLNLPTSVRVPAAIAPKVQEAIVRWVAVKAVEFHARNPIRRPREVSPFGDSEYVEDQPPDVPFRVFFKRELHWGQTSGRHDGYLRIARYEPPQIEGEVLGLLEKGLGCTLAG